MLRRRSTTLEASRGEAGEDTITFTGLTERGTSRSDRNWRVGGRRGPGGDAELCAHCAEETSLGGWVFVLPGFEDGNLQG